MLAISAEDAAVAVSFGVAARFVSCVLDVLHEAALSFIHVVALGRIALFVWIIKSRSCCMWASAEIAGVYVVTFFHQYYAVVLEAALIKTTTIISSDGSTTI